MQIEIKGEARLLEQIRLRLQDQLEQRGFSEGPKVGFMSTGVVVDYLKKDSIISIHVSEETDEGEAVLRVESEKEVPELNDAWDDALIRYGKDVMTSLRHYAIKKDKVERGLQ